MPRSGRIVLPDYPHHIIQRGHNRQIVFAGPSDYGTYLDNLSEFKAFYGIQVYAFCLMTNHVHLILQPGSEPRSLGLLMKRLAGRQTRYVNRLEGRSGSLWESRYKSSPIETDAYLLACCRYVELNPVRAGIVDAPDKYPWSSYRQRIGLGERGWLDIDPCFEALGRTDATRRKRYADFVGCNIAEGEWDLIREAVQRGQLTGSARFVDRVEAIIGRRIEHRGPGRPRKNANAEQRH